MRETYSDRVICNYAWGSANMKIACPDSYEAVSKVVGEAGKSGASICPIGGLNGFGDIQINDNSIALDLSNLNKVLKSDMDKGKVVVQAGMRIVDLLKIILPFGWTLSALSGSMNNTIAGNISSNINGKDSWKFGSFYNNVLRMKVLFASGEICWIDAEDNKRIFDALLGGFGLIGIILEAELRLVPVHSSQLQVVTTKFKHIEELVEHISQTDINKAAYFYGWCDMNIVSKNTLGNSILNMATDILHGERSFDVNLLVPQARYLGLSNKSFWSAVRHIDNLVSFVNFNDYQGYFLNRLIYLTTKEQSKKMPLLKFLYPLTGRFGEWKYKFYPKGFREIQILANGWNTELFIEIREICRKHGISPELCGIRKHIEDSSYLSFSKNGYSFTINYSLNQFGNDAYKFERKVVQIVLKHQAIINVSKFPFLEFHELVEMYPRSEEFFSIKKEIDPNVLLSNRAFNRWSS